ncbi:MAG: RNA polymerase sigma factor [Phycisphaeraceae bacterium]|nr:MAG: RNA polymerase sigma factor [Phycisphaeraceae bacterium]
MPDQPPILTRIAAGEPGATEACIAQYGGLVWSLALRLCPTRELAEDAVQDAFVSVWKSADRYDPAMGSEVTFVATITRRRIVDLMRRTGRIGRQFVDNPDAATSASAEPAKVSERITQNEDVAAAIKALDELSPEQQRVIRMSVMQGLSHQQISEATGLPLGTVKTHLRRGLIRVRESLAQANDGVGVMS